MEVKPKKMDGTDHMVIMRYPHDAVYCLFFRGIPPSTEKLLQSFMNYHYLFFQFGPERDANLNTTENNILEIQFSSQKGYNPSTSPKSANSSFKWKHN